MRQDEALNRLLDALGARIAAERGAARIGRGAEIGANAATRAIGQQAQPYVPFGFPVLSR